MKHNWHFSSVTEPWSVHGEPYSYTCAIYIAAPVAEMANLFWYLLLVISSTENLDYVNPCVQAVNQKDTKKEKSVLHVFSGF